jgi:uncharacterized SAM-dependent methyltransferase
MVLTARQSAVEAVPGIKCFPFVCDLATARDLASVLSSQTGVAEPGPAAQVHHVFTFFGMMPNFEPGIILPQLAGLIEPGAQLLLSANLAPGPHYTAGVEKVLPLYDNALTRDWLMSFLLDLGVEKTDGELNFTIEELSALVPLRRIAAYFHFERDRLVELDTERVDFRAGEAIRLFFSYRHTPALIQGLLNPHGLTVLKQWVTGSQEEGVFLVKKV